MGPKIHILALMIGATVIFLFVGTFHKLQRPTRLTENEYDPIQFDNFKKLIALFLLFGFIGLGIADLMALIGSGGYPTNFNTYFTALIFSGILIVLLKLRYSTGY